MSDAAAVHGHELAGEGKPIIVRHRTEPKIKAAPDVPLAQLIDPPVDSARVQPDHARWIAPIGIGAHRRGVPLGNQATDPRGNWAVRFWPCHGSQYSMPCHGSHNTMSRRTHRGPPPANLAVPGYAFDTDSKIKIG